MAKRIHGLGDTTPIVKAMRDALYAEFRKHFDFKNSQGNSNGWWRSNFWAQRVRDKTKLGTLSATRGEVNVSSYEFAHKLTGGTVKPTGGRKALAIPLCSAAKKLITPALVRGDPSFVLQPMNKGATRGIIFKIDKIKRKRTKKGNQPQSNTGESAGKKKPSRFNSKQGKQQKTAYWVLKTSVYHKPDPTAEPKQADVNEAVNAAARAATLRAFRAAQRLPEF